MKKFTISMLATLLLVALSMSALAQAEDGQSNGIPYKTPNSVLYGSDVIIDNQPAQDQRNSCLSVAFNGWLYACYSTNESGTWRWKIFLSTDDGATWTILRDQGLSADWYVQAIDIVVTGTTISDLKVFVSRILNNSVTGASELIISQLDGNSGATNITLRDNVVTGGDLFRDVAIASDYLFPAVGAVPFSIGVLYSKYNASADTIRALISSNGGTSIDNDIVVTATGGYVRNVSLAYGRCFNYFNGRYFAAWEERGGTTADIGQIWAAHSETFFYDPFTAPFRLENLIGATENFARNPSISCQFNDVDNDLMNLTEVVLFERAYNGNLDDMDVVGLYNKEAAGTDNWFLFGLAASASYQEVQADINFDPGYNNFLATYYNGTMQKLPYVVKHMNMADPYNWLVINDGYNDGTNLTNPYPKVEINPGYLQVGHVWNAEGPGMGIAMFDAEYSHVGIQDHENAGVAVSVSPNPAAGIVTFRIDMTERGPLTVQLFNLQGKEAMTVVSADYSKGMHSIAADVSSLPEGCYLYRVAAGEKTGTGRLIVKK